MKRPIAVRSYQAGDEVALWDVFFSAVRVTARRDYSQVQVEAWAPDSPDPERWKERIAGIAPCVASIDGRIVGYADVQADGYIDHFFVAAEFARQGVGSELMRVIHQTAREQVILKLYSDVSLTARPFFEHWGFTVEALQTVTVRGVELTNMRMSKRLDRDASDALFYQR